MNEYDLTEDEMRDMINKEITLAYPKMKKDEKRITSYNYHLYSDLLSFVMTEFLGKKSIQYQFQVCCVNNKELNYMGKSMSLNLRSSTSPYWSHIRKESYNYRSIYLAESDKDYITGNYDTIQEQEMDSQDCVLQALEQLDFYHKPLLTDYYLNGLNYSQLNKKYGISPNHLKKAIDTGISIIKQQCKQFI